MAISKVTRNRIEELLRCEEHNDISNLTTEARRAFQYEVLDMLYDHLDSAEVVRCKDCKYRKFIDWGMGDCTHKDGLKGIAYDESYCDRGERRATNESPR